MLPGQVWSYSSLKSRHKYKTTINHDVKHVKYSQSWTKTWVEVKAGQITVQRSKNKRHNIKQPHNCNRRLLITILSGICQWCVSSRVFLPPCGQKSNNTALRKINHENICPTLSIISLNILQLSKPPPRDAPIQLLLFWYCWHRNIKSVQLTLRNLS